ncbi:MAG: peptide chain release factor N(5)-glutamine methyltransferase, partial [Chitinophagales bacterium]
MMLLKDLYRDAHKKLSDQVGAGEARARLDILLEDVFDINRNKVLMDPNLEFSNVQHNKWKQLIGRMLNHEPIQYICGSTSFYDLKFKVSPAVLIPRSETEELVKLAMEKIKPDFSGNLLDIGTGSGCIVISIAKKFAKGEYYAVDFSEEALAIANENARLNRVAVEFIKQDFLNTETWNDLPDFDVILSNPPYVTLKEWNVLEEEVKDFEPEHALHPPEGESPLVFYKKIAAFAIGHLNHRGFLLLEINEKLGKEVLQIFSNAYFTEQNIIRDINGKERF